MRFLLGLGLGYIIGLLLAPARGRISPRVSGARRWVREGEGAWNWAARWRKGLRGAQTTIV